MSRKTTSTKKLVAPSIVYKVQCLNSQDIICKPLKNTNESDSDDFKKIPAHVQKKIEKIIREKYLNRNRNKNTTITKQKESNQRYESDSSVPTKKDNQPQVTPYFSSHRSHCGGSDNSFTLTNVNSYPTAFNCTCKCHSSNTVGKRGGYETEYSLKYCKINEPTRKCREKDFKPKTSNLHAFQRTNDEVQTDSISTKDFAQNANCSKDMIPKTCDACISTNFPCVCVGTQTNLDELQNHTENDEEQKMNEKQSEADETNNGKNMTIGNAEPQIKPSYMMRFSFEVNEVAGPRLTTIERYNRRENATLNLDTFSLHPMEQNRVKISEQDFKGSTVQVDSKEKMHVYKQQAEMLKNGKENFEKNIEQKDFTKKDENNVERFSFMNVTKKNSYAGAKEQLPSSMEEPNVTVKTSRHNANLPPPNSVKRIDIRNVTTTASGTDAPVELKIKNDTHSVVSGNTDNEHKAVESTDQAEHSSVDNGSYFIRLKRRGSEHKKQLENEDSSEIIEIRIPRSVFKKKSEDNCSRCSKNPHRMSGGNQTESDISDGKFHHSSSSEPSASRETSEKDLLETKKRSSLLRRKYSRKSMQAFLYENNYRAQYTSTDSDS